MQIEPNSLIIGLMVGFSLGGATLSIVAELGRRFSQCEKSS